MNFKNLSSRPSAGQIPSKKIKESKAKELVKKATNSEASSRKRTFASLGSRSTSQVGLNGTGHGPGSHSGPLPVDPSMAAKFIFKSENTKPGAFYLEARSLSQIEKDSRDNNQETGYRLLSTQHRYTLNNFPSRQSRSTTVRNSYRGWLKALGFRLLKPNRSFF